MQSIKRSTLRSMAAAAGIAIMIAGSTGIANAAPAAEDSNPPSTLSSDPASTPVFQTPLVTSYTDDLVASIATIHLAAEPSDTAGTVTLTIADPIDTLFATAPPVDVHWRNLSAGTSGVVTLESDSARTEPVDVVTGSGRIVATFDSRSNTLITGFATFSVD